MCKGLELGLGKEEMDKESFLLSWGTGEMVSLNHPMFCWAFILEVSPIQAHFRIHILKLLYSDKRMNFTQAQSSLIVIYTLFTSINFLYFFFIWINGIYKWSIWQWTSHQIEKNRPISIHERLHFEWLMELSFWDSCFAALSEFSMLWISKIQNSFSESEFIKP